MIHNERSILGKTLIEEWATQLGIPKDQGLLGIFFYIAYFWINVSCMFRHHGKGRTLIHNLRLAISLSLVAGIVNICGVFSIQTLTTNVTGHFAFFAENLVLQDYLMATVFIMYVFCFLLGSFLSGFLTQVVARSKARFSPEVLPLSIEILTLVGVWLYSSFYIVEDNSTHYVASAMLFAMGVQNSLVTQVSKSIVRTTHLTGLFTDLGIELAQLFFYRKESEQRKLSESIYLRGTIILFFFVGCIFGGFVYKYHELKTLLVASAILIITLFYDVIRYQLYFIRRRVLR